MAWRLKQLEYDKGTICRFSKGCRTHQQGKLPENDGQRSSYIWRKTTFHTHQSFPLMEHQWHWPRHSFQNPRIAGCAFCRFFLSSTIRRNPVLTNDQMSSQEKTPSLQHEKAELFLLIINLLSDYIFSFKNEWQYLSRSFDLLLFELIGVNCHKSVTISEYNWTQIFGIRLIEKIS